MSFMLGCEKMKMKSFIFLSPNSMQAGLMKGLNLKYYEQLSMISAFLFNLKKLTNFKFTTLLYPLSITVCCFSFSGSLGNGDDDNECLKQERKMCCCCF